ncbi:hypothetical protein D3C77_422230 [compost metagenome]
METESDTRARNGTNFFAVVVFVYRIFYIARGGRHCGKATEHFPRILHERIGLLVIQPIFYQHAWNGIASYGAGKGDERFFRKANDEFCISAAYGCESV